MECIPTNENMQHIYLIPINVFHPRNPRSLAMRKCVVVRSVLFYLKQPNPISPELARLLLPQRIMVFF